MPSMVLSLVVAVATAGQIGSYGRIPGEMKKDEFDYQKQAFNHWWGQDLETKLSKLPTEGKVPDYRVPYSGHDYPDMRGGTIQALYKYDQAFHRYRDLSVSFEQRDISLHRQNREPQMVARRGLFGRVRYVSVGGGAVPTWYGHCNGWTAAAIRHAEPQRPVTRNGVTFTPADIKGLLAEIYMYSATEFLGGVDDAINPATFHLSLTNWLGRGSHPIGMETAVGEVVINFPIFAYRSSVHRLSERQSEVRTVINYTLHTPQEYNRSPRHNRTLYFHYLLDMNEDGEIVAGRYYSDSARIDMLWTPLKPTQGGEEGNERGNPHLNVKEVLAIWRASVPEELRKKWLNVDPTEEDRILPEGEPEDSAPVPQNAPSAPATDAAPLANPTPPSNARPAAEPTAAPPTPPADEDAEGREPAADDRPARSEREPAPDRAPPREPVEPAPEAEPVTEREAAPEAERTSARTPVAPPAGETDREPEADTEDEDRFDPRPRTPVPPPPQATPYSRQGERASAPRATVPN